MPVVPVFWLSRAYVWNNDDPGDGDISNPNIGSVEHEAAHKDSVFGPARTIRNPLLLCSEFIVADKRLTFGLQLRRGARNGCSKTYRQFLSHAQSSIARVIHDQGRRVVKLLLDASNPANVRDYFIDNE